MWFPGFEELDIIGNKMTLLQTSSQLNPMTVKDLRCMNIEEYLALVQADDNQLQDLVDTDINLQPNNGPKTLNGILDEIELHQTQVQEPLNVTRYQNINNQSLSQQHSSDEMTFEEFLIDLGVVRAPSQMSSYPQQTGQYHSGALLDTNNSVPAYATGGSLATHESTINGVPFMVPLGISGNETNQTTRVDVSMATNARRRRRMIRIRQHENRMKDGGQGEQA